MTNFAAAGISFFGTEHAISDQIEAYKHDAQVDDFNAATTRQQEEASDQSLGRDINAKLGTMSASYAGSGVQMSGSPMDVLADSIRKGVLDRASNRYNYETTARNYESDATGKRLLAHNIQRTQFMAAASAGLASFSGSNGGMGGAGTTGQTTDTATTGQSQFTGGNSLNGGTYVGSQSLSTSWTGDDSDMWDSNSSSDNSSGGWGS